MSEAANALPFRVLSPILRLRIDAFTSGNGGGMPGGRPHRGVASGLILA